MSIENVSNSVNEYTMSPYDHRGRETLGNVLVAHLGESWRYATAHGYNSFFCCVEYLREKSGDAAAEKLCLALEEAWPRHVEEEFRLARGWAKIGPMLSGSPAMDCADPVAVGQRKLEKFDRTHTLKSVRAWMTCPDFRTRPNPK